MLRRVLAPVLLMALVASALTGCANVRIGARCRTTAPAHAGDLMVACRAGRWRATGVTVRQVAALLVAIKAQRDAAAAAAAAAAPTLTVEAVVGGLAQPWDIGFTPDGMMLVTEKAGRIDAVIGGAVRTLAAPSDVVVAGEGGMMGLAVDPNFASNRRIYACLQSNLVGAGGDIRVARFEVSADATALANRADIVTGIPTMLGSHNGCRPRFGPDAMLWIGTGDATIGTTPQDDSSLGGKVLRVTTDGAIPPGATSIIHDKGHRNVQGLAFRPADGMAFSVEHGPGVDDEVNRLVEGGNYGWNPVPGYNQSVPMTFAGAIAATWSSGNPTIAPSGATFLSGPQWRGWNGALAMAVLKGSKLLVLALDAAGTGVVAETSAVTDQGRLRSAVQGPDGNLYLATDANPGRILRVTPS